MYRSTDRTMFYKLQSKSNVYYASVVIYKSDELHKVFVGGKKKCVVISVYPDDPVPNLDAVSFDEQCNEQGDLLRGRGTVDIVKSAMAFVKQLYGFNRFQLTDKSHITCRKKVQVSLIHFYLAKYQKTWYEDKFNAIPLTIADYKDKVKRLRQTLRTKPEWDNFSEEHQVPSNMKAALGKLYNECDNLGIFFKTIANDYDCYLFKDWLGIFIDKEMGNVYATKWVIQSVDTVNVEKIQQLPSNVFISDEKPSLMNLTKEIYGGKQKPLPEGFSV